ncbi:hypothetical protein [Pseudarthrobacter sp. PvP090]|uniref:hypothetical protein n=1 Tax=Pseudarthrobacter sp. PvP090 TaxID=3156393 RepID=UPI003390C517
MVEAEVPEGVGPVREAGLPDAGDDDVVWGHSVADRNGDESLHDGEFDPTVQQGLLQLRLTAFEEVDLDVRMALVESTVDEAVTKANALEFGFEGLKALGVPQLFNGRSRPCQP